MHEIQFRSEGGKLTPGNQFPACNLGHERFHNGIKRGGKWVSGRQYMIEVLESYEDKPWFRWKRALNRLRKREALKRVGDSQ